MNFKIRVDTTNAKSYFQRLAVNVDKGMQLRIATIGVRLSNKIKSQKLTGNPLKVQTGLLRNSIHSTATSKNNIYTTNVGTNIRYAAIHEYGFRGSQSIRSHSRTITQAFGKPISSTTFTVSSHTRNMHMPMRSFARSALAQFEGTAVGMIAEVVENHVQNT